MFVGYLSAILPVQVQAQSAAFHNPPTAVPGWIEAEDFDIGGEGVAYHDFDAANNGGAFRLTEAVDLVTTSTGSGFRVGWTAAGEWMNYTVNVLEPGLYRVALKASSGAQGGVLHFAFEGAQQTLLLSVPPTGGWETYATLVSSLVRLEAGIQIVRLWIDASSGFDIDGFRILQAPAVPPAVQITQPLSNQSVVVGVPVVVEAAATSAAGTISKVEFYVNNSKMGEATVAPYKFVWTAPTAGGYEIIARATDNAGIAASSSALRHAARRRMGS